MLSPIIRQAIFVLVVLVFSNESEAGEISFDEAIEASLNLPSVQAPAVELEARKKADRSLSSNRGPLNLSLTPGWRLNPSDEAGAEFAVALSQSWNLANLSKKRKNAAQAERTSIAAEERAQALAGRITVAQRWLELYQAEQLFSLIKEELDLAAKFDASQRRALKVGVITVIEQSAATAAYAETKRLVLMLEGHRVEAALGLCLALGAPPDEDIKTKGALPAPVLPSQVEIARLASKVDTLPQVALKKLQGIADSARESEVGAGAGRKISFGLALQRESTGSTLLMGTLGFQFSGPNKAQRGRSVLGAQALRKALEAKGIALALRIDLADAIHEVEHTQEEVELIASELLPARSELLVRRERELSVGEGTVTEVLRSKASVFRAKRLAAQAKVEHRWAKVHLWLLLAEIEMSLGQGEKR